MDRYEELLNKYGLTPKTYEQCLQEIHDKVLGIDDQDWSDIVAKYNLPMSKDTVRKASSQEIFGNVFVMDYFRNKQNKQSDIKLNNDATQNYRTEIAINKDGSFLSNKLITMSEDDLKNMDNKIIEMMKIYEVTWMDKIFKIYIPIIKFYFISIFVSTFSLTFKVVIAGEVHGQPKYGIGSAVQIEKINFNTSGIFAWIIIIAFISISLEIVNKLINKKLYRWQNESRN